MISGGSMHKNPKLKQAIDETITRLKSGDTPYSWGHFGRCNCGHIAQTITNKSDRDIHKSASLLGGDWGVRAEEYCPVSRYLIDDIIRQLLTIGLEQSDLVHLENLSDPKVLQKIPGKPSSLERHSKGDAIKYLIALSELCD